MKFAAVSALAFAASVSASQLNFQTGPDAVNTAVMAPLNMAPTDEENSVPVENAYIVRLKDVVGTKEMAEDVAIKARTEALSKHQSWLESTIEEFNTAESATALFTSQVSSVYDFGTFQGYAGKFTPAVLTAIRANPEVEAVDQDVMVTLKSAVPFREFGAPQTGFYGIKGPLKQTNATWGLQRISHTGALPPYSDPKKLNYVYDYSDRADGTGVDVYVIDTGVNIKHPELIGRAIWGKTTALFSRDADGNGHGTHVAGTIASLSYGIAKNSRIIAVKVLSDQGSGMFSWIIQGIEYAAKNSRNNRSARKAVANMSLGGTSMPSLDAAVDSAVDMGIVMVVAAGNDNKDACRYSPAASKKAITVAASDINDQRAYFSNWGKCVDLFAPGRDIVSTYLDGVLAASGTSMASPHVAGVAAALYTMMPMDAGVDEVKKAIYKLAELDAIKDTVGSPNILVRTHPAA